MDAKNGGKPYWATSSEMFARAFSDWVRVRAADQAGPAAFTVNDYLAPLFLPFEDMPYPHLEGEETMRVFSAVDRLVDAVRGHAQRMFQPQAAECEPIDGDAQDEDDETDVVAERARGG